MIQKLYQSRFVDIRDIMQYMCLPHNFPIKFAGGGYPFVLKESPPLSAYTRYDEYVSKIIKINRNNVSAFKPDAWLYINSEAYGIVAVEVLNRFYGRHNLFGPAMIHYNSLIYCDVTVSYYDRGYKHRVGDAYSKRYLKGRLCYEQYRIKDRLHNSVGPAIREFIDGRWFNKFYINGKHVSIDRVLKNVII